MNRPAAVIFDCDGTIADTLSLVLDVLERQLRQLRYVLSERDLQAIHGLDFRDLHRYLASRVPGLPPLDSFKQQCIAAEIEAIATAAAFADAVATLDALHDQNILLGVASSSERDRLDATLTALNLGTYFAASLAGDEVAVGKPAPDIYAAAAAMLARCARALRRG